MKNGADLCCDDNQNVKVPDQLIAMCKDLFEDSSSDSSDENIEFSCEDVSDDWFELTNLHGMLSSYVDELFDFKSDLKKRVEAREVVSLLN